MAGRLRYAQTMKKNLGPLTLLLSLLCSHAYAESPVAPLRFETQAADVDLTQSAVAFSDGDGAVFAGAAVAARVAPTRKGISVEPRTPHPAQPRHRDATTVPLGASGALAFLFDDQRQMRLARLDGAKQTWVELERPIGFVLRGYASVGQWVVFPQGARAPAWFVYDVKSQKFARVERPAQTPACGGVVFALEREAVTVGEGPDGKPCALGFSPEQGRWRVLASPPAAVGEFAVGAARGAYILGKQNTLALDAKGQWRVLPPPPWFSDDAQALGSSEEVVFFRFDRGVLSFARLDVAQAKWTTVREEIELEVGPITAGALGTWWLAGRVAGRPVVARLSYAPKLGESELVATRPQGLAQPERDWKKATQAEKQEAIRAGHGAVERYVPPVRDPSTGKIKTKGAWVFALGEELVVWPVPPRECRRFIEKIVAKWPTQSTGTKWVVERGAGFARAGKRLLYAPGAECEADLQCPADYFSERVMPLSQVGPVFSYSVHTNEAVACGTPAARERWISHDLRTHAPAALDALLDPASLLAALRRHKVAGKLIGDATTLDEAIAALRQHDVGGGFGYAFGGWRSLAQQVEVQLEFHPERPDSVEPIKILVAPKSEYIEMFVNASRTPGLLAGESM